MDLIRCVSSLCAGGLSAGSGVDVDDILTQLVHYVKVAEALLPGGTASMQISTI